MRRAAFALLLLVTFGIGLFAGPHPCQAAHGRAEGRPAAKPMSGHASCHGMETPVATPDAPESGPALSSATQDCCKSTVCRYACDLPAAVSVQPFRLSIAPVAESRIATLERDSPLLAYGIDHIPLA
jgi:hypothetical protein